MIRKAYPTDLTDAEGEIISPLVPEVKPIGRPRQVDLREIINGIFYVLHEGCTWRALPHDLPPWQTVYNYFRYWQQLGVWQQMHTQLRTQVRASVNKTNTPTASIIDSQSVKTAEKRGKYTVTMAENGSRDVNTLSRVDTLGLLLAVIVTEANFPERLGGVVVVMEAALIN